MFSLIKKQFKWFFSMTFHLFEAYVCHIIDDCITVLILTFLKVSLVFCNFCMMSSVLHFVLLNSLLEQRYGKPKAQFMLVLVFKCYIFTANKPNKFWISYSQLIANVMEVYSSFYECCHASIAYWQDEFHFIFVILATVLG